MKTTFFALTMAAALSCGSLPLHAQDAPPPPPPPGSGGGGEGRPPGGADRVAQFLKQADADSDGKLSKDEFVNSTKKDAEDRFSRIDANADGFIEKSEAEEMARRARDMAQQQQRPEGMRRPEGGGGDRDGGVRPRPGGENQPGGPPPGPDGPRPEGFRRPDGEGGPRPEGFRRPDGEGGGSPGMRQGGMSGGGMGFMADRLRRMDKNDDKSISKDEFLSSSEEQFAQMDENKDGNISAEEIEALGRRMREMMGGGGRGGEGGGFRRPGGEGGGRPRPEGEGERPRRPEGEAAPAPAPAPQN